MTGGAAQLEQKIVRIRREYGDEMSAKQIACEEGCSEKTARRRMSSFEYGGLTRRSKRDVRCFTTGYVDYLRSKLVLQKGAA
jgi:transposase